MLSTGSVLRFDQRNPASRVPLLVSGSGMPPLSYRTARNRLSPLSAL